MSDKWYATTIEKRGVSMTPIHLRLATDGSEPSLDAARLVRISSTPQP
jgi:hypothetical protein